MAKIGSILSSNTVYQWQSHANKAYSRLDQFAVNESTLYANTISANVSLLIKGQSADSRYANTVQFNSALANTNAYIASVSLVSGTAQSASGTSVDFTGIPSWVKRITVTLDGVSAAAGGGTMYVRIGNGTVETTGYFGVNMSLSGSSSTTSAHTTGIWAGSGGNGGASLMYGTLILTLHDASTNTWSGTFTGSRDDTSNVGHSAHGRISLSGTLDVLSLVITSSTFDAGKVNIMYE